MIVLGKDTDDKGTQLEQLTRRIMEELGYENIVLNRMGAAGEIDVTGEHAFKVLGGVERISLVCECKAKKDAVGMPDWLKFLGKVYVAELQKGHAVIGCFVALSDANGVVYESYDAIRAKNTKIRLVSGDALLGHLAKSHGLSDPARLRQTLRSLTDRLYREIDVVYYEGRVYWLVFFEGGAYTIMDAGAAYITRSAVETMLPYIEADTTATKFVDLSEEALARKQMADAQRFVLAAIILGNGRAGLDDIAKIARSKVADDTVVQAFGAFVEQKWLEWDDAAKVFGFTADRTDDVAHRAELFRFILTGRVVGEVLGSDWWNRNVDERLLDEALRTQLALTLDEKDRLSALKLMRWSPNALLYALIPDQMIVLHRTQHPEMNAQLEETDRGQFMRSLHEHFVADYQHPEFAHHFGSALRLPEMRMLSQVAVKDSSGAEVYKSVVANHLTIGEIGREFGGGFAHMRPIKSTDGNPPDEWTLPQ